MKFTQTNINIKTGSCGFILIQDDFGQDMGGIAWHPEMKEYRLVYMAHSLGATALTAIVEYMKFLETPCTFDQ